MQTRSPANMTTDETVIHQGRLSLLKRSCRTNGKTVIIKKAASQHPTPSEVKRLRHEFKIAHSFEHDAIVRYYSLQEEPPGVVLEIEDFNGISLADYLQQHTLELPDFFKISLSAISALAYIHDQQVIHRDIKPANIIVQPETLQTKLTDFGLATIINRSRQAQISPHQLEGTLSYIAPEQTGRLNRAVDARADFYALGITLYEMLAGRLPFTDNDPMTLVHAHIARTPPPLPETVPPALSAIIGKLLEKNPEDRYKSAHGIQHDLQRLQDALACNEPFPTFIPGEHDIITTLNPPEKLYGRETELGVLLAALQEAADGKLKLVMVDGVPGIGKSALIQELRKPVLNLQGRFTSGKFEQFAHNQPYQALLQILQSLLQQMLTESDAAQQQRREKILATVGEDITLLLPFLNELAEFLAQAFPDELLEQSGTRYRLTRAFVNLLLSFTDTDAPLVLFLDDLQWADASTLDFLTQLTLEENASNLLLIGAYRSTEVGPDHPLRACWDKLNARGVTPAALSLGSLPDTAVAKLLADTLCVPVTEVSELAAISHQKTDNNPLFLKLFLQTLYEQTLLKPNPAIGCWEWDTAKIQQQQVTENVVDLALSRLDKLPTITKKLLQLAALLGDQLNLNTLSLTADLPHDEVRESLMPAVREDLMLMFEGDGETVTFKFAHDRIQQAAYQSIPETERDDWHIRIGQQLLDKLKDTEREAMLLDLVGHLNRQQHLNEAERIALLNLNKRAMQKAREAGAHEIVYQISEQMMRHVPDDYWATHYELCRDLHLQTLEACLTCSQNERVETLNQTIIKHARNRLDKSRPYISASNITMLVKGDNLEALRLFHEATVILGEPISVKPSLPLVIKELLKTRLALLGKSPEMLKNLPEIEHPEKKVLMNLINAVGSSAYFVSPLVLSVIVMRGVQISVRYGNTPASIYCYTTYGMLLSSILGDIEQGYVFGQIGRSLAEKFSDPRSEMITDFVYLNFVAQWKDGIHKVIEMLPPVHQRGMQYGEIGYGLGILLFYTSKSIAAGKPLNELAREVDGYLVAMQKAEQTRTLGQESMLRQAIAELITGPGEAGLMEGEYFQSTQALQEMGASNDKTTPFWALVYRAMLGAIYGQWAAVLDDIRTAGTYASAAPGQTVLALYHYYYALAWLINASKAPKAKKKEALKKSGSSLKKLQKWAKHCPQDFVHKVHLVEAEIAFLKGDASSAGWHYAEAIELAAKNGFINDEALAAERAAHFCQETGHIQQAEAYFRTAFQAYRAWGAEGKNIQLQQQEPTVFSRAGSISTSLTASSISSIHTNSTNTGYGSFLDLHSVLQASQILSGEIQLERLLTNLMRIALENAGAQWGVLLLPTGNQDERWHLEAEGSVEQISVLQGKPLNDVEETHLPTQLCRLVIQQQTPVVLPGKSKDDDALFEQDAYLQQHRPASVLCLPLLNQGQLAGILYMENRLTRGAFTPSHLEVLRLLSAQMAQAIDNARLYAGLEDKVQERTREIEAQKDELANTLAQLQAAQEQLVESEKMAALGNLVAGVAHEINTPLGTGVTAASQLENLLEGLSGKYAQSKMKRTDLESYLSASNEGMGLLMRNLKRAADLVKSFKQVAVDQSSEQQRSINLKDYCDEILTSLQPQTRQCDPEINLNVDNTIEIITYPGALSQILTNLIMNSLIHGFEYRPNGKIDIELQLESKTEQPWLHLTYTDNGQGVDANTLKRIFEPFFTTRREGGGSGLGMHIVYNLVTHQLGGQIGCSSESGQGVRFRISFPVDVV